MEYNNGNLRPNDEHEKTVKRSNVYVRGIVERLANYFGVQAAEEVYEAWAIALCNIRPHILHVAAEKAIEVWTKPGYMPPLAIMLDLVGKYGTTAEDELIKLAKHGDKEAERLMDELRAQGRRAPDPDGTSSEDRRAWSARIIAEMRAKIAAGAFRLPPVEEKYKHLIQRGATQKPIDTKVPKDPTDRQKWAHDQAVEFGWLGE